MTKAADVAFTRRATLISSFEYLRKSMSRHKIGLHLSAVLLLLSIMAAVSAPAQMLDTSASKQITFSVAFPANAPLRLDSLTLHGESIPINTPVQVAPSWPEELKIGITNTTPKTLTYFSGSLGLSSVTYMGGAYVLRQSSDPELGLPITGGLPSDFLLRRPDGTPAVAPQGASISIGPGETAVLTVSPTPPDSLARLYDVLPKASEARFMLLIVWYADDTSFFNGALQKIADLAQRRLQPMTASEFYGK